MPGPGPEAMHRSAIIDDIIREVREKKVVDVAELAARYGYSYAYFRYHIMKEAIHRSKKCIEVKSNRAFWVCEE